MKHVLVVLLFLLSSVIFSYPAESSDTYYVSTSTGDDNNTGSFTDPWKTIQRAADNIDAGDTVYIREGTYYEEVFIHNKHGTHDAWITFRPYNNENVIVDGRNISNKWNHSVFKTTNTSYLHITGFTVSNSARCGFWINAVAETILIDHNTIQNCSSNALYTDTSTPYTITNLSFQHNIVDNVNNNWSGNGSTVNEAVTFRNVQTFDISHNHISRCGKECIDAKHGSAYGTIHHNTIDTSSTPGGYNENYNHIGIYIDAYNDHSHDIDVYCNYIIGDHGYGIAVGVEQPTGSLDTIRIYNNIINVTWVSACGILVGNWGAITGEPISDIFVFSNTVLSDSFPLHIQGDNLVENIRIENNIFKTTIPTILRVKNYEPSPIIILRNNLFYTTTGAPCNEWNGASNISWGEQAILSNPLLQSDYKLKRQSPAIDTGRIVPIAEDYQGNPRPRGTAYDIGAFEYPLTNQPPTNKPPVADATAGEPYRGLINTTILFNGSNSYDPDGNITSWYWEFGDNTNGTGKIRNHLYSTAGTYQITLTVTDEKGATNTTRTTCQITQPQSNVAPTPSIITGPTNGTTNTTYIFSACSTDPENDTIRYTFTWGEEPPSSNTSTFLSSNTSFTCSHYWITPGQYIITVTATDNHNESIARFSINIRAEQIETQTPGFEIVCFLCAVILTLILLRTKQKK